MGSCFPSQVGPWLATAHVGFWDKHKRAVDEYDEGPVKKPRNMIRTWRPDHHPDFCEREGRDQTDGILV